MPAGVTAYTALANVTLGSSASTVTFSSISGSYRDLVLVMQATTTGTAFSRIRFNNDSGGNYSWVTMEGNGSSAQSNQGNGGNNLPLPTGSSMDSSSNWMNIIHVFDYTQTNKGISGLMRSNNPSDRTAAVAFRWGVTAVINQVQFIGNNQPFAAGSTFALYGVSA
jgi:hypothetical protein